MNFRESKTKSGKMLLAGKSAEQNEEVVKLAEKDELVLHTAQPGSPFVVIKGKPTKKDVSDAALFCATYSQDWRDNKSNVEIHIFKGCDIHKEDGMKTGTFSVKKAKKLIVQRRELLNYKK